MVDFKRLAQGRKGIKKAAPEQDAPEKPEKTLEESCREEVDEADCEEFRREIGWA